jgi:transaldolase
MSPEKLDLKVKIFADGADKSGILEMHSNPLISGFTTNPTLMRGAGVTDYEQFALDILSQIKEKPISFEVLSDRFDEMERQALKIASWGNNVYVKIPITNSTGKSSVNLVEKLSRSGVRVNVTAMMTLDQVSSVLPGLAKGPGGCISIFAGRIADTGVDPVPIMREAVNMSHKYPNIQVIWASPRELLNLVQADLIGCDIITVTNDLLKKIPLLGKDLHQFSIETVQMFYNDAVAAGFTV